MQTLETTLEPLMLVGISCRTSNQDESKPETAKISGMIQEYLGKEISSQIQSRVSPGTTYCVYTDYESDELGSYTYFIGEAVSCFEGIDSSLQTLSIPTQNYKKFEVGPGPFPASCIEAWQKIWQMGPEDFGAPRSYVADFEVYDERALNPQEAIFDIYIGLKA